jgi:hypothetical protein
VGKPDRFAALRTAIVAVIALVLLPFGEIRAAPPAALEPVPILTARSPQDVDAPPLAERWSDDAWGVSIAPPAGWRRSPAESLNPVSQPADPVFEVARFQLRLGDPSLYAQPVSYTQSPSPRDRG